jgi:hypothetical protein
MCRKLWIYAWHDWIWPANLEAFTLISLRICIQGNILTFVWYFFHRMMLRYIALYTSTVFWGNFLFWIVYFWSTLRVHYFKSVTVLVPTIDNYRTDTFADLFSESIVIFQNQGSVSIKYGLNNLNYWCAHLWLFLKHIFWSNCDSSVK